VKEGLLDTVSDVPNPHWDGLSQYLARLVIEKGAALLTLRNIHKWFERVHALNGVDLYIYPGEVVGLVGDNDAGKSTLVKVISGRLRPDKGEIFREGEKVKSHQSKMLEV